MVYLAVALVLAVALAARPIERRRRAAALLGLAILVEFVAIPLPLTRLDQPPFYQRLAAMPAGAVIDLPLGLRDGFGEEGALDHRTLYYQTLHGKPIAGGFVARLPESVKAVYHGTPFLRVLLGLSSGAEVSAADLTSGRDSGEPFAAGTISAISSSTADWRTRACRRSSRRCPGSAWRTRTKSASSTCFSRAGTWREAAAIALRAPTTMRRSPPDRLRP